MTLHLNVLGEPVVWLVAGGGPHYPPNQFGAGRGNYDNFRGPVGAAGGYPKQRSGR